MAWVNQHFDLDGMKFSLHEDCVKIEWEEWGIKMTVRPSSQESAHGYALMFRRAARRFEEIGKGLQ